MHLWLNGLAKHDRIADANFCVRHDIAWDRRPPIHRTNTKTATIYFFAINNNDFNISKLSK